MVTKVGEELIYKEISYKIRGGGFTLIELLVVISIIGLLSAVVAFNYRVGGEQLKLHRSAYKMAQDIRKTAEMAMSATEFRGAVPPGGYGIHLRTTWPNYYILYADLNGNQRYNGGEEVETIFLERGVRIWSISPNNLSINFKPPNPIVRISTEDGPHIFTNATIILALEADPSKTKTIEVKNSGLVEVK